MWIPWRPPTLTLWWLLWEWQAWRTPSVIPLWDRASCMPPRSRNLMASGPLCCEVHLCSPLVAPSDGPALREQRTSPFLLNAGLFWRCSLLWSFLLRCWRHFQISKSVRDAPSPILGLRTSPAPLLSLYRCRLCVALWSEGFFVVLLYSSDFHKCYSQQNSWTPSSTSACVYQRTQMNKNWNLSPGNRVSTETELKLYFFLFSFAYLVVYFLFPCTFNNRYFT